MPAVATQTDFGTNTVEHLERTCAVQQLVISNGWHQPIRDDGLTLVMNKKACEELFFYGFPSGDYHFKSEEWEKVKDMADKLLKQGTFKNYCPSNFHEAGHMVKSILWHALGFPLLIVYVEETQGLLVPNIIHQWQFRFQLGKPYGLSQIDFNDVLERVHDEQLARRFDRPRRAFSLKPLKTKREDFRHYSGSPMNLQARELRDYLYLNATDVDVDYMGSIHGEDETLSDLYRDDYYHVLQVCDIEWDESDDENEDTTPENSDDGDD
eukprot:Skav204138  [mRNA]  locus=scaffold4340:77628:78428:+ [translate_table: standard]